MKKLILLSLVTSSFFVSCGAQTGPAGIEPVEPGEVVHVSGVHTVRCGCVIEEVRHCGNYVLVEGVPRELTGDLGLGAMEFCGQGDQQAEIEGSLVDGAVVATSYELVE